MSQVVFLKSCMYFRNVLVYNYLVTKEFTPFRKPRHFTIFKPCKSNSSIFVVFFKILYDIESLFNTYTFVYTP